MCEFQYHDGGRADAGYKGTTGDCVVRAIAIASGKPYQEVYDALFEIGRTLGLKKPSPRTGVKRKVYDQYLASIGWSWTPTMQIGSGCQVHLTAEELPEGTLIARLSGHIVAVKDGVVYDNQDPRRDGTRCVYGYWTERK